MTAPSVRWTQAHLGAFEIAATRQRYRGLAGDGSLEISAKVIMGEMQWPAPSPVAACLAAGKKLEIDVGGTVSRLDVADASRPIRSLYQD